MTRQVHARVRIAAEKKREAEAQARRDEDAAWAAKHCEGKYCLLMCCVGKYMGSETEGHE